MKEKLISTRVHTQSVLFPYQQQSTLFHVYIVHTHHTQCDVQNHKCMFKFQWVGVTFDVNSSEYLVVSGPRSQRGSFMPV